VVLPAADPPNNGQHATVEATLAICRMSIETPQVASLP
jgi:hypothetical protein